MALQASDPTVQGIFDRLKAAQDGRVAEWNRPLGARWSGFEEVVAPVVRTDAELWSCAEERARELLDWQASPEGQAERARIQALRDREEAISLAVFGSPADAEPAKGPPPRKLRHERPAHDAQHHAHVHPAMASVLNSICPAAASFNRLASRGTRQIGAGTNMNTGGL